MSKKDPKKASWKSYAFVLGFFVIGITSLVYWGPPNKDFLEEQDDFRKALESGETLTEEEANSETARVAQRYVTAVQNGVCSRVIELTWWMQERLAYVRENTDAPVDDGETLNELCESITSQRSQSVRLRAEGIEDPNVFVQMAEVRMIRLDEGRSDLAKPVRNRVWLRVKYPVPTGAVADQDGNPIKSMVVGMNVSTDGYVLKAGLIGNLEIDFDSISYDW